MYPYYNTQQIIKVNGINGAKTLQMGVNSSALLLDEREPLIYLAQTDGAGYKSVTTYKIEPYAPEPEPDFKSLAQRLERLEAIIRESHTSADESADKSI